MKAYELIKILQDTDPENEIVMQLDGSGNAYKKVRWADDKNIYINDYEVLLTGWPADEVLINNKLVSKEEWEEFKKNNKRCVVLEP